MRLHLLSLPHTVTTSRFSHCAFTGKVQRFAPMLRWQDYHVIHYGVAGAESGANEDVVLMEQDEHLSLLGIPSYDHDPAALVGNLAQSDNAAYRQFNFYLRTELAARLQPGDAICLPFGHAHEAAYKGLPLVVSGEVAVIETGIGYPKPATMTRVYESEAWRHWTLGNEQREGMDWRTSRVEWVVPNYYDLEQWPVRRECAFPNRVVYLGRLEEVKGLALIPKLAQARPDLEFVLCGQGDPTPFITEPNIIYQPPIHGAARAEYLGAARCGIFPSRFVEPFCGAAVECMLTGTPVLTSDFGAFTETNIEGETGWRCRSEAAFLRGLDEVEHMHMHRHRVAYSARERFGMDAVGRQYAVVFAELQERMASMQRFTPAFA